MMPSSRAWQALLLLSCLSCLSIGPASGAFINFENCLPTSITQSNPLQLQWIPFFFDAKFNTTDGNYTLTTTIYGNVSGQQFAGSYPPADSPQWSDPNNTFGKIANVGTANKYSTLLADFTVLTYDAYNARAAQFCPSLISGKCPLGPVFTGNASNPDDLRAFQLSHNFGGPYSFSTLAGTVRVISGDTGASDVACVSANITPDLGPRISGLITWLPAAILTLKGIATLSAAIWSPWGSSDIFRWSSNYGRDEDLLRLVTPGFGDCLQYIQFVTLTGALSLQYPGYYQPAVSKTAWSLLLFNESYVSHGNGTQSLVDGIYKYNGTYGMTAMSQLIGMTSTIDIWACMAVWLLVIVGILVLLCQLGFLSRFIYRTVTDTTEEDLRSKNLPFTLGNMVRLLFNYFILPIVSLSLFQLVIASRSPASVVACAVILLIILIVSAGWIFRVIFKTKPRTHLFDDMPTVLLYGPLYNTYSDSAAPFAMVPVLITFMRGVAIGAIQPSGIAQIIVLAICEVILILTLNGFRPFQNQTSMNAYHTFFAAVRLVTVLLSIAFVQTLGVSEATKGWIGYAILLLHACVLVFGYFLNAAQTLIEVTARYFGVGGDSQTGAVRGSILSLRMLKRRRDRPATGDRGSMTSNAAILQDTDQGVAYSGGRSRSMSASSQQLLNQAAGQSPSVHRMSGFENFSSNGEYVTSPSMDTDNLQAGFTYLPDRSRQDSFSGKQPLSIATAAAQPDTFYRPPRPRRATNDLMTPGAKTRNSRNVDDFPYQDSLDVLGHGRQSSYADTPAAAYIRDRADSNENLPRTDYAVREVDQYYRGPALSDQPTRKLKTGPADPEGPAASAQSWLQRLRMGFKGKQKEPSKGFEVVRSSRMPQVMQSEGLHDGDDGMELQTSPPMQRPEPYRDSPELPQGEFGETTAGAERNVSLLEYEDTKRHPTREIQFGVDGSKDPPSAITARAPRPSHDTSGSRSLHPGVRAELPRAEREISADTSSSNDAGPRVSLDRGDALGPIYRESGAPSLDPIESVGGIDLPSRFNSRRSTHLDTTDIGTTTGGHNWLRAVDELEWNHGNGRPPDGDTDRILRHQPSGPPVPRRSSRRHNSEDMTTRVGQDNNNLFEGFDSAHGSGHTSPDLLNPSRNDDRPSSFAQVTHHRAAESISLNSFGAHAALHGTSAEFFGHPPLDPDKSDDFRFEG